MASKRPKRPANHAVASLLRTAMESARPSLTIADLAQKTGLGRGPTGALVRGEVQRIAPDQANRLVQHLPITMEQLLAAYGYNIGLTQTQRLPADLAAAWPLLARNVRVSLVGLVSATANPEPEVEPSEP